MLIFVCFIEHTGEVVSLCHILLHPLYTMSRTTSVRLAGSQMLRSQRLMVTLETLLRCRHPRRYDIVVDKVEGRRLDTHIKDLHKAIPTPTSSSTRLTPWTSEAQVQMQTVQNMNHTLTTVTRIDMLSATKQVCLTRYINSVTQTLCETCGSGDLDT